MTIPRPVRSAGSLFARHGQGWVGIAVIVAALGLGAEFARGRGVAAASVDFAVGLTLIGSGLVVSRMHAQSRIAILMVLSCTLWYLGTLQGSSIGSLNAIGVATVTLHRGPLLQALITVPSGRVRGVVDRCAVLTVWLYAALPEVGNSPFAMIVIALALTAAARWRALNAPSTERVSRRLAVFLVGAFGVVTSAVALNADLRLPAAVTALLSPSYHVIIVVSAGWLAVQAAGFRSSTLAHVVVDLGEPVPGGLVATRLGSALGDPSLELLLWLPEIASYTDEVGRPRVIPDLSGGRVLTVLEDVGKPLGVIVHDEAVLGSGQLRLVDEIRAVTRLAVANASLQAEVRRRTDELRASRRRILAVADVQRRHLADDLRRGAGQRLVEVDDALASTSVGCELPILDELRRQAGQVRTEISQLADGLRPTSLTEKGLASALPLLCSRLEMPVAVDVPTSRFEPAIEAAVWFVCSEALSNVVKYAHATIVSVSVTECDGRLLVRVADNGGGGADATRGTGLQGLADRAEALGGSLSITSSPHLGTTVLVELVLHTV